MVTSIVYTAPNFEENIMGNCREVVEFIRDDFHECPRCGGKGEYEGEYGPEACAPCNSRLIAFTNYKGEVQYADWGDMLIRTDRGIHLIRGEGES